MPHQRAQLVRPVRRAQHHSAEVGVGEKTSIWRERAGQAVDAGVAAEKLRAVGGPSQKQAIGSIGDDQLAVCDAD